MNFKKIAAGTIASAMALGTLAVTASAGGIYVPEETHPGLSVGNGAWQIQIYNTGKPSENKPAVDYGIDPTKIASMTVYFDFKQAPDGEFDVSDFDPSIDGMIGGAFIYSENGGVIGETEAESPDFVDADGNNRLDSSGNVMSFWNVYNWPSTYDDSYQFWGLPVKGDTPEGQEAGTNQGYVDFNKGLAVEYISENSFSLTCEFPEEKRWIEGGTCYQTGFQEWGNLIPDFCIEVSLFVCRDDAGEIILAFDGLGYQIENDDAKAKIAEKIALGEKEDEEGSGDSSPDGSGDTSGDNTSGDTSGDTDGSDAEGTTTTTTAAAASSSSSSCTCGGSNASIVLGVLAVAVVAILLIKKRV